MIEANNQLAGMIVLKEDQPPEYKTVSWHYPGRPLVVHRLTIDPKYQRWGLGKQLMVFAEAVAMQGGYDTIRLDDLLRTRL